MPPKKPNYNPNAMLKFRETYNTRRKSSAKDDDGGKPRYLTTDTSFSHVFMMIFLRACRFVTIDVKLKTRLTAYFLLIVFGGLLCDFAPVIIRAFMPIKTGKDSVLNQYFVKIGWGWTLALMVPFVSMTADVITSSYPKDASPEELSNGDANQATNPPLSVKDKAVNVLPDLMRVAINTAIWYVSTSLFVTIDTATGSCVDHPGKGRVACYKAGGRWSGFDISGHTFLLMFSTLSLLSEATIMSGWEPLGNLLSEKKQHYHKKSLGEHRQQVAYERYSPFIRVNFVLITFICLLWDFMLMQTALYYHSMIQKAVAGLWAVGAWFVAYKVIYEIEALAPIVRSPLRPPKML